jgi:hypothetical protein
MRRHEGFASGATPSSISGTATTGRATLATLAKSALVILLAALSWGQGGGVIEVGPTLPDFKPRSKTPPLSSTSGGHAVREKVESLYRSPVVAVVGADHADRAALRQALELFAENGLHLPDLEIRFFDTKDHCGGHFGLFESRTTPWRILICSSAAFVLPHELAHAWEAETVEDRIRELYLEARGLEAWSSPYLEWGQRGVEDAAFVIQQNLTAGPVLVNAEVWRDRIAAYELLTGKVSPLCLTSNPPVEMTAVCSAGDQAPGDNTSTASSHQASSHPGARSQDAPHQVAGRPSSNRNHPERFAASAADRVGAARGGNRGPGESRKRPLSLTGSSQMGVTFFVY